MAAGDYASDARLVTVVGGSGFVGRHVVRALARHGYRVRVAGSGKDACVGLKETTLGLGASKAEAKSSTPRCPAGWILAEESVQGGRFTCRARPPLQPLRCPGGTTYFAEGGEIGCR